MENVDNTFLECHKTKRGIIMEQHKIKVNEKKKQLDLFLTPNQDKFQGLEEEEMVPGHMNVAHPHSQQKKFK